MVAGALVRTGVRALTKAGKQAGKKKKNQKRNKKQKQTNQYNPKSERNKTVNAQWSKVDETGPSTPVLKTQNRNPVSTALDRRHEYRMKYGKEIERGKSISKIGGSASTSVAADSYGDLQETQELAKAQVDAAEAYADAEKARAEAEVEKAANTKNEFTYTENKNWNIQGLNQVQNGGATTTVDPSSQYENQY